jgi:hypothetical protein
MGRRITAGIAAAALVGTGLALTAPAAGAATYEVTSGADDGTPGTFRWAVEQAGASPGDDIVSVAPSVTAITLDDCAEGRVVIAPSGLLTIEGNGTTITQTCDDGVIGGVGDTSMSDLTLTGGDTTGDGGAIQLNGGLTLDGVTITGNVADGSGGGIFTVGATITNSTIADNGAADGGGIYLFGGGDLTVTSSTIERNEADASGGGIWGDGQVDVVGSQLRENRAATAGGGALVNGFATITDSTVADNEAGITFGGVGAEFLTLIGSTVTGNAAAGTVGGAGGETVSVIRSAVNLNLALGGAGGLGSSGTLSIDNSTVSQNLGDGASSAGPIDLSYATIVGNSANNIFAAGPLTTWASAVADAGVADCSFAGGAASASLGFNFASDASCAFGQASDTNAGGDPMLTGLGLWDGPTESHLPVSGSPLLNKVPTSDGACSGTDQRGFPRPANGACDIGAVEIRQVSAVSSAITTPYETSVVTDLVPLVTDPDGVLSEYEVQGVLHGSLDAADGGLVTYTPARGFTGTDTYTYIVCSTGDVICTTTQTITISVGPGPAANPVAAQPTFTG